MLNMIGAELYKMYKSSAIKLIFGITSLCAAIMTVMAYMIPRSKINPGSSGIGFLFSDINVISILGAVMAGVFICGDFDNKTIHEAITCGTKRITIVAGKAIAFFCAVGFILVPYAVAAVVAVSTGADFNMGNVGIGFLYLLTKNSGMAMGFTEIAKLLIVMVTIIIVYIAQLSLCVPLAIAVKRPVLVVAVYYGVTLLNAQLLGLKNSSEVFNNIYSATPYGGDYSFLTIDTAAGDIIKALIVSLICIMVMLAAAHSVFRKSEIK
ncbi:MAG: hypothetical protein K0R50_4366 [Eubacterium sp.]|jgi:ABC-2 type transport system permease protein|nr:hypothetical protein [Eubacterium sp.]